MCSLISIIFTNKTYPLKQPNPSFNLHHTPPIFPPKSPLQPSKTPQNTFTTPKKLHYNFPISLTTFILFNKLLLSNHPIPFFSNHSTHYKSFQSPNPLSTATQSHSRPLNPHPKPLNPPLICLTTQTPITSPKNPTPHNFFSTFQFLTTFINLP